MLYVLNFGNTHFTGGFEYDVMTSKGERHTSTGTAVINLQTSKTIIPPGKKDGFVFAYLVVFEEFLLKVTFGKYLFSKRIFLANMKPQFTRGMQINNYILKPMCVFNFRYWWTRGSCVLLFFIKDSPGHPQRNMTELGFLKICLIGTAFSFLLALFGLVDSVGGLMYPQGPDWADDSWTEKLPPGSSSQISVAANNTKRHESRWSSQLPSVASL